MFKRAIRSGLSFGLTSGIITTLGLMVGLHAGTHSRMVVLGGILTIAVADALSDALGMHISEESENKHSEEYVWASTISTLLSKFAFAMSFVLPVLLFDLQTAISISIIWGLLLITALSYFIARGQKKVAWKAVGEHLAIAVAVILITHAVGDWIGTTFVG